MPTDAGDVVASKRSAYVDRKHTLLSRERPANQSSKTVTIFTCRQPQVIISSVPGVIKACSTNGNELRAGMVFQEHVRITT